MDTSSRAFITVVSGLPRSGTSLMMQMLQAGGLPALTDQARTADEDNPRGYFEFEPVKQIKTDRTWLPTALGKAVKMVHLLLYDLPGNYQYRVILMRRDLEEVVRSQAIMLQRSDKKAAALSSKQLIQVYESQLASLTNWLATQSNIKILEVSYLKLVSDPATQARAVATFLDGCLNVESMAAAVDPTLYRNRRAITDQ
jgi:hypothetical protein